MAIIPSGADVLANTLLVSLTAGADFDVPSVDLTDDMFGQPGATGPIYNPVTALTIDELTSGQVAGSGVFDKLMVSLTAHLKVEYTANRISGAEYTKAYLGVVTAALQAATQFLLTKDQAYWQALLVQAQAKSADVDLVTARVNLENTRVTLVRTQFDAATAEAGYALTKMKLASEDINYSNLVIQGASLAFTLESILPKQASLVSEQVEVQRAQTADTRTDGVAIVGAVGKQKDLYSQQIDSYKRDSEQKVAKIFSDAWITQKTVDEGLLAPAQFNNENVNAVLLNLRTKAGMA